MVGNGFAAIPIVGQVHPIEFVGVMPAFHHVLVPAVCLNPVQYLSWEKCSVFYWVDLLMFLLKQSFKWLLVCQCKSLEFLIDILRL